MSRQNPVSETVVEKSKRGGLPARLPAGNDREAGNSAKRLYARHLAAQNRIRRHPRQKWAMEGGKSSTKNTGSDGTKYHSRRRHRANPHQGAAQSSRLAQVRTLTAIREEEIAKYFDARSRGRSRSSTTAKPMPGSG